MSTDTSSSSSSPAAIVVRNLVKNYQGLRPLRVRELSVTAGERVALSGLDATAAEVFVNLLNGAILPDEGEVRVFGRRTSDIVDEAQWLASLDRFGIVTPRAVLLDMATVRQNLALPLTIDLDNLPLEILQKTEALAHAAGIAATVLDERIGQFGADVRMRVHLGRAMATEPEVLLLEHPTATLPREAAAPFAQAVRREADARRLTLLAITEDSTFADIVASSHWRLQGGSGALVNARGWRRWL